MGVADAERGRMKITSVHATVVRVPRTKPYGKVYTTGVGAASVSEHGIVQVETDGGVTGLGEISTVFSPPGATLSAEVNEVLGPALMGLDPFELNRAARMMEAARPEAALAIAGVEMALWDVVGKALDTPVYNLLGGRMRERIPISYSIPYGSPAEMAAFASGRAREGIRTVKVKIGQEDERDVEAVRQVRKAVGPSARVRADANARWSTLEQAVRVIERLYPYDLELIEQPAPGDAVDLLAQVRRSVTIPIMADESVWMPRDAVEIVRREAADIVNVYVSEAGGLGNAAAIFSLCEHAGIGCMIGSMPELGIGTAAQIHLGIAMPNLDFDSDTCGTLYHEADLLAEPLRIEGGFAYPPGGPGLGVELDEDALARFAVDPHG